MKWLAVLAIAGTCAACGGGSTESAPAEGQPAAEGQAPAADGQAAAPAGSAATPPSRPSAGPAPESRPAAPKPAPAPPPAPAFREVTLPSGTSLRLELKSAVASDTSSVEDAVRATLRTPVTVDGVEVLPAGTEVVGAVTDVERSGRVKGRARVAYRFTTLNYSDDRYDIATAPLVHEAEATKSEDATKIAIGTGVGAAIGAVLGGGDGAAKGAAIGGAGGTGAVLATRGKEVRLGPGADVTTRLTAPLTLRVRQ
jgi:hypothetical protein